MQNLVSIGRVLVVPGEMSDLREVELDLVPLWWYVGRWRALKLLQLEHVELFQVVSQHHLVFYFQAFVDFVGHRRHGP